MDRYTHIYVYIYIYIAMHMHAAMPLQLAHLEHFAMRLNERDAHVTLDAEP